MTEERELRMFQARIETIGLPEWGIGAGANDKRFKTVKRMLEVHGQLAPIVVRDAESPDDPAILYELIDGEKRLAAAADLGWTEIYVCHVPDVDGMKAREYGLALFGARGDADKESLADTLTDLQSAYSGDAEQFARLGRALPFHSRNIHKMINKLRGVNRAPDVERRKSKVLYRFKVPADAADTIDRAVDRIVVDNGATRDQALEFLAAEFLSGDSGLTGKAADVVKASAQRLREKGVDVEPKTVGGNEEKPPESKSSSGLSAFTSDLLGDAEIVIDGNTVAEVHAQLIDACPSAKDARQLHESVTGVASKSRDRKAVLKRIAKKLIGEK
jgi:ParB-like chromosome segregation protein Spo0J